MIRVKTIYGSAKCFLLSRARHFPRKRRTFNRNGRQSCQCYRKITSRQQLSMVCILIDHRNCVKTIKTLRRNHSPAALGSTSVLNISGHFDVIWISDKSKKPWKIVVDLLNETEKKSAHYIAVRARLDVPVFWLVRNGCVPFHGTPSTCTAVRFYHVINII